MNLMNKMKFYLKNTHELIVSIFISTTNNNNAGQKRI